MNTEHGSAGGLAATIEYVPRAFYAVGIDGRYQV